MIHDLFYKLGYATPFCLAAAVMGLIVFKRMSQPVRLIIVLIWIAAIGELAANWMNNRFNDNNLAYNLTTPIKHLFTLFIYIKLTDNKRLKFLSYFFISVIIVLVINIFTKTDYREFNTSTYLISGILLTLMSYLLLRKLIQHESNLFNTTSAFVCANLLYYPLMIASIGSQPLASKVSNELASSILHINYVAYIIWSIIITTGLSWNLKRTTYYS